MKIYASQVSFEVTDAEKQAAEKALMCFEHASKRLLTASDYLNLLGTPFTDNPNISSDEVMKARAAIRRFRDKAIENFNDFKKDAFQCVNSVQIFGSDTQIVKLMKSFISSIDDLEESVNDFSNCFNDLNAKDFAANVVKNIQEIQKECEDVEEIIDERIKNHIKTNILATSWVDTVSNDLNKKIEEHQPLLLDLYNKREEQLQNILKKKKE